MQVIVGLVNADSAPGKRRVRATAWGIHYDALQKALLDVTSHQWPDAGLYEVIGADFVIGAGLCPLVLEGPDILAHHSTASWCWVVRDAAIAEPAARIERKAADPDDATPRQLPHLDGGESYL